MKRAVKLVAQLVAGLVVAVLLLALDVWLINLAGSVR